MKVGTGFSGELCRRARCHFCAWIHAYGEHGSEDNVQGVTALRLQELLHQQNFSPVSVHLPSTERGDQFQESEIALQDFFSFLSKSDQMMQVHYAFFFLSMLLLTLLKIHVTYL